MRLVKCPVEIYFDVAFVDIDITIMGDILIPYNRDPFKVNADVRIVPWH